MSLEIFINNIILFFRKSYKSYNKLELIEKLFIFFLLLLFSCVILKNFSKKTENFKNDEIGINKANFTKKFDNEIYDKYFSNKYDKIYLNPKRNNFEIDQIKNIFDKENTKILDIGCGTGYNVNILTKEGYNITGLDQSKDMINYAKNKYDDCNFVNENILTANTLDYNNYNLITCLGRTLYEIQDKDTFFENCYNLLEDNGILVINIIDKNNFNPYIQDTKSNNVLFNPEKFNKTIDNIIVKFNDNLEFTSNYSIYDNTNDEKYDITNKNAQPYSVYLESFKNYGDVVSTKNYELNLYIPKREIIKKLAESKGFKFDNKISLKPINLDNEFLYFFRK